MPIIYNYTEEELIRMYIEFSKELKKKNGASISDFYKYAKSHDMPSFKYLMTKFKTLNNLRKKSGFEVVNSNKYNYTEEELIQMYIELSKKLKNESGAIITDIDKYAKLYKIPSSKYFQERFGTFENLRIKAGFERIRMRKSKHSEEELIQIYIEFSKKMGKENGATVLDFSKYAKSHNIPSFTTLIGKFKSVKNLREKAGFEKISTKKSRYSEEELIQMYIKFSKKLEKEHGASALDFNNYAKLNNIPSFTTFMTRFKLIKILREKAGFKEIKKKSRYSEEELIQTYVKVSEELKKENGVSGKEYIEYEKSHKIPSFTTLMAKFKSIKILRRKAGFEEVRIRKGRYSGEELIQMYIKFSKEMGKENGASALDFYEYAKSHNMPSYAHIIRKFKSIKILKEKAGFEEKTVGKRYNLSEEELIQKYIEFSKKIGKENGASISDFYKYAKSHDMPSFSHLMGKFKSIKILRKKAGFEGKRAKKYNFSEEELIQIYIEVSKELKKENGASGLGFNKYAKSHDIPPYSTLMTKFKSTKILREKAGFGENSGKKTEYSEEELIQKYIEFSKKIGKEETGASSNDIYRRSKIFSIPSYYYYFKIFGSIKNIRRKAGFEEIVKKGYDFSEEELVQKYIEFSKEMGKEKIGASSNDIQKQLKTLRIPSYQHYFKIFGSIKNLRKKAGFEEIVKRGYGFSEEELIEMYIGFSKEQGKEETGASANDFKKNGKKYGIPSYSYLIYTFKSTGNLKEKAGFKNTYRKRYNYTEEELINMYIELSKKLEKYEGASAGDLMKYSRTSKIPSYIYYKNVFGSMENLRVKAGFENITKFRILVREKYEFSEEELIQKYIELSKKIEKYGGASPEDLMKYSRILELPSYTYYKKIFGSMKNLKEKAGYLSKSEIQKARKLELKKKKEKAINIKNKMIKKRLLEKEKAKEKKKNKELKREIEIKAKRLKNKFNVYSIPISRYEFRKTFDYNELSKSELIEIYKVFSEYLELENGASKIEFEKYSSRFGIPAITVYMKLFKNINTLKEESNYKNNKDQLTLENHTKMITYKIERQIKYSDMEIKKKIYDFYNKYNRYPEAKDCVGKTIFIPYVSIVKLYISIEKMYRKLEIDIHKPMKYPEKKRIFKGPYKYTNEELIQMYIDFSKHLGKDEGASLRDLERKAVKFGIPGQHYFMRKYKSMYHLKKAAGYNPEGIPKLQFTRNQIVDNMYKYYKEYGRTLSKTELDSKKDLPSWKSILRYIDRNNMSEAWEIVLSEKEK